MELYINMETGEVTDTLPWWDAGYGDIAPWKRVEDVTMKDMVLIVGRLQKRVAELEEESYHGAEDVGG